MVLCISFPALLAACGVDGPPSPPPPREEPPERRNAVTMTITGTASVGVTGGRAAMSRR